MADEIHEVHSDSGGMTGVLLGVIIVVIIIAAVIFFGRGGFGQKQEGTQINVPDKIDVNVDRTQ